MKSLKLFLVSALFGLLCKTIDANRIVADEESFSVEKVWRSYHKKSCLCTCPVEDAPWLKGVDGHYEGCKGAIDKFCGKAKELGDVAIHLLAEYLAKLIYFTDSNSTIVTTSSTAILDSLSKGINLNGNGLHIITEFEKICLPIIDNFCIIAELQSVHIGDKLTCAFTGAVRDLGRHLSKYMKEFLQSYRLSGCRKKVDYDCVQKKLQELMNVVALINKTLLNKCAGASQEVHEAVMVFDLLYVYWAISVQGINSCALDALNARNIVVSESDKMCSLSFEYAAVRVTQAICDVDYPFVNNIGALPIAFVNIDGDLNATLKGIFGHVDGITNNLLKGII